MPTRPTPRRWPTISAGSPACWAASLTSPVALPPTPPQAEERAMEQHDFLVALVVFLVAAVVAVPVARRFGLGAVLGYLLAGVAIGPWALRLVTNVESILHFSEFGVVLMMFVIGLELEPKKLWELRRVIFGYGG